MLLRFDPFREFDRVTHKDFGRTARTVPMDVVRRDDTVTAWLDLPGVAADSIDLEVERNVVTVSATRSYSPAEGEQVIARERRQGTFSRQLFLGDSLDAASLTADYADGVLTLSIPVAEQAKPRKVSVGAGSGNEAIEAEASDG